MFCKIGERLRGERLGTTGFGSVIVFARMHGSRRIAFRCKIAVTVAAAADSTIPLTRFSGEEHLRDPLIMPKTVLVVEDNELNMKLFHDLLEASGYNIVETRNGLEAMDLARSHRPDLILMDIQLPEVSGLEVTKWLKEDEELRSIPVIAVTAFAMKGDEERIRQGGCEAYLSKPISVTKFLETVKVYLGDG